MGNIPERQETYKFYVEKDELQSDKVPPTESDLGVQVSPYKIGRKEWEELYISVLYTIKHKLGANSSGYSVYAEDLYEYAQEAFCMSVDDHRRFLAIAQDEKPPILVLNVIVAEAQGLEAKDPNGFSDPYCMLGIQPGNLLDRRNSYEDEFSHNKSGGARRQGGLKKLGASLKRKDRRERSNSIIMDTLPAKFIRTTSVKPQTLNPRWNEQFRLDIEDIKSDILHLDIWDHDDESSVFDAARKLNEVSSLKGLGRYFKQIAQSARTSTGENIDDFLGCVNIRLEDIPSSGLDRWFSLEGRTERSSVQGKIRLKITLSTREDKDVSEEDNWKEVVEHQELVWVFVEHELIQNLSSSQDWAGDLPQPALTILHQHAIQGDITELQQTLCRWTMYSRKHMEVPLDYALLYQLLDDINKSWGDMENPLTRDEEAALADSFNSFLDFCLQLLQKHRDLFPPGNKQTQTKLTNLLKCITLIHRTKAFKWCCPFRHELHVELTHALKKGTMEWFSSVHAVNEAMKKENKCPLKLLIDLVNILNRDIYKGFVYYNEEFESTTGVSYSVVVYKQLEKMVNDIMGCKIQEICHKNIPNQDTTSLTTDYMVVGTAMFELYMALQEFVRFKEHIPNEEKKSLSMINYHLWFSESVHHWFVVAKAKAMVRIRRAIEIDKVNFLDNYVKHSTSAVDTATCFVQIKEFWRQLSWPDASGSYTYVLKVIEIICEGTVFYAKLCQQKLPKCNPTENEGQDDTSEKLCITANNMEYVLQMVRPLEEELGVENIIKALNVNQGSCTANQCREVVYDTLNKTEDEVTASIFGIICTMVDKLRPIMKKFVFHLAWAPEKLDAENAIRPLLENMDTTLRGLYNNLLQANFDRLLDMMWTVLMHELTETAQSNIGKERLAFFDRLYSSLTILVDFFHGDGKGLPLDCIQNAPYQDLFHVLKLQKEETQHLIELYTLQRLEEQQKQDKAAYGYLTIKASYNPTAESLYIDILNARELIPLDPTGFSDPFVIIELVPHHFFPSCMKQKTKVQKKTLYPLFDEAFEFRVSPQHCHREGAGLCFSVMDHDMVTKNDFEGEAFLPLCNVVGVNGEDVKDLRPTELYLMHPNEKDEILMALSARAWDKDAQDFVKNLKNRR